MNYYRGPQLFSELLEHLKILKIFKCPNLNTIWVIQKSRMVLEICATFLAEVFNQSKNDELFQGALWVH